MTAGWRVAPKLGFGASTARPANDCRDRSNAPGPRGHGLDMLLQQ